MKTSELTGAALDWAVAKCQGWIDDCLGWLYLATLTEVEDGSYHPSTDWSQGGPIIERQEIELVPKGMHWDAYADEDFHVPYSGPTPLIAAMRCFVASKLGDEVELPDTFI